jgi:radical SAM superfamily enzyme YgiQ (UPF0313 family)
MNNNHAALDLLLINPSLDWQRDRHEIVVKRIDPTVPNQETPNIGIAYLLATAKKAGIRARYIDMVMDAMTVEDLIRCVQDAKPRLVGFTAFTVQIRTAAEIAARIKKDCPGVATCVGGAHALVMPHESLAEFPGFDFAVSSEAEAILPAIVEAAGNEQKLSKIPGVVTHSSCTPPAEIKHLDALPFPAWEQFDLTKYPGTFPHRSQTELPMVTGRGCPFRCTFCCRALGDSTRRRSVASVVAEIEHNIEAFRCTSIAFLDETFVLQKKWTQEFLATMNRRGLNKKVTWGCTTRVSNMSAELFQQMANSGCYYVFLGLESADDNVLKLIKKNITVEQMRNAVHWAKMAGVMPVGAFIIGLPSDTEELVMKDIALGEELQLYSVTFPIAVPFPGTELRDQALRNEYGMRIISDDWNHYGKQEPGVMESEALSWARRRELQKLAYSRNPKKLVTDYLQYLKDYQAAHAA